MPTDDTSNTLAVPFARQPTVRVVSLRPMAKGSLRALVDIELVRAGLVLRSCGWFRNPDGKEWVTLPAQRYEGPDGVARFTTLVSVQAPRRRGKRFQEAALAATRQLAEEDEAAR
jgi:hypothetical protein